jgi:phosphoribosylglycinamide formyltransferase 2
LHAKSILGLPINKITFLGDSASAVIKIEGDSDDVSFSNLDEALEETDVKLRLFGKPGVKGKRRMGVVAARCRGGDVCQALEKAKKVIDKIEITL